MFYDEQCVFYATRRGQSNINQQVIRQKQKEIASVNTVFKINFITKNIYKKLNNNNNDNNSNNKGYISSVTIQIYS